MTQKDASVLNPDFEDVHEIGTVVNIIQMLRLPDNTIKVLIEGKKRAKIESFHNNEEGYFADISDSETINNNPVAVEATLRTLKNVFEQYVK